MVTKVWQQNLDYTKNLQAKYFTNENIPIYGIYDKHAITALVSSLSSFNLLHSILKSLVIQTTVALFLMFTTLNRNIPATHYQHVLKEIENIEDHYTWRHSLLQYAMYFRVSS